MSRIFVRFTEPGFHHWPDAPESRAYLRARHRHVFHYEISLAVRHDERDVEFHDLIDQARASLPLLGDWNARSCEAIAREICHDLAELHGGRQISVTVSEDGEAGATIVEEEL